MIATKLFVGHKMLRRRLNMYLYKELSIDIRNNEIKAKSLHYPSLFAIVEESKQLEEFKKVIKLTPTNNEIGFEKKPYQVAGFFCGDVVKFEL
tara:strand:- start:35 stop:313 length:279 start_codon:yes stop_codon:yes gene_type:complete